MSNEMGIRDVNEQPDHRARTEAIKEKAREYSATAREKAHHLKEKWDNTSLQEMEQSVEHYMRENPGKSLGIAAGIGFLVGLVLGGRRHH